MKKFWYLHKPFSVQTPGDSILFLMREAVKVLSCLCEQQQWLCCAEHRVLSVIKPLPVLPAQLVLSFSSALELWGTYPEEQFQVSKHRLQLPGKINLYFQLLQSSCNQGGFKLGQH